MLCPNAGRETAKWGLDPVAGRFVSAKKSMISNGINMVPVLQASFDMVEHRYGVPWWFTHRIDLHNALKELAVQKYGAKLVLNSKVKSYDLENGSIALADGSIVKGDLIVAADGVHSTATPLVLGEALSSFTTDHSAFRCLIPTSELAADPVTAFLVDKTVDDGRFKVFTHNENRLVWYPCRDNLEQNIAAVVKEPESHGSEDWDRSASVEHLMSFFPNFSPELKAVLGKTIGVKKWPLLYRPPISRWFRGKLVLIGDAAHPMLPHQGQAGAQAIEDVVALSIMLEGLTKADLIKDSNLLSKRLELFQKVRSRRAASVQIFSNTAQDQAEKAKEAVRPYVDGKIPGNPAELMEYNFSYDIREHAERVLKSAKANERL
jgi:salicylate hydroxylase